MLDKQLATTYILTQWVKKYEKITLLGKTANYCLHRAKKSNQKSPDSNENLKKKRKKFVFFKSSLSLCKRAKASDQPGRPCLQDSHLLAQETAACCNLATRHDIDPILHGRHEE